jgi:hypothetical protein
MYENIDHVFSDERFSSGDFQVIDSGFLQFSERAEYFIGSELISLLMCTGTENAVRASIIAGIGDLPYDSFAIRGNRKQAEFVRSFLVHIMLCPMF